MTAGSATHAPPVVDQPAGETYVAGRYFTDRVMLYRIVGWLSRPVGPDLVEVEECRSLDRVLVRSDELPRLRLRAVRAESDAEQVEA